jgi:hypothetical protein
VYGSDEKEGWKWEMGYISRIGRNLLHVAVLFTFPFRMTVIFCWIHYCIKSVLLGVYRGRMEGSGRVVSSPGHTAPVSHPILQYKQQVLRHAISKD